LIILGLNFGHDAAAAVIRDGRVVSYVLRERHARIKHAMTLQVETIETALAAAGVAWSDVDFCAITSTQDVELVIDDGKRFQISFAAHDRHREVACAFGDFLAAQEIDPATMQRGQLMKLVYGTFEPNDPRAYNARLYRIYFPEHATRSAGDFGTFGWIDHYFTALNWTEQGLDEIAANDWSGVMREESLRLGSHLPVSVTLDGKTLPGFLVAHHSAHAASVYYQSGYRDAGIVTHDGFSYGADMLSGMLFRGEGNRIYPIVPHRLFLGAQYDAVGLSLKLGDVGPAGKLMGLAAYGQPRFFDHAFVGNWFDVKRRGLSTAWWEHCVRSAQDSGYDTKPLGDRSNMTAPVNIDIAASTQKLFEETALLTVHTLQKMMKRAGLRSSNLCLSGGTALNCPANGRIHREGPFPNVFVEPGCDDSGIAIGAALFLYHNVMDKPLAGVANDSSLAYLGVPRTSEAIDAALKAAGDDIQITRCNDAAREAAEAIASDKVIAWFEGRSEIGPRALGHRSLLADPRPGHNWPRLNRIKGRETWRPFAPAVLAEKAHEWFRGTPLPSPHMLFTGQVNSTEVPAITHVDGSSRIQTVDRSAGRFHDVIRHFGDRTGVPVVLNTSFNGPGEPIVETVQQAIAFLLRTELDELYIDGHRIVRAPRVAVKTFPASTRTSV
jgi:carbamoyltransferase